MENKEPNKFTIKQATPKFIIRQVVEDTEEQTQVDPAMDQPEVVSEETTNVEPPKKQMGVAAKTVASTPKKNTVSGSEVGYSDYQGNKKYDFNLPGIGTTKDKKQIVPEKETIEPISRGNVPTLPKAKEIAKAIKKEGPISERALGELKQGLYTTEFKKSKIAEIEAAVEKEELGIENPYAKYSELNGGEVDMSNILPGSQAVNPLMPKSTLSPQSYKVQLKGDTFVNDVFNNEKLKEIDPNFNFDNFDGFLSKNGYKDEFRKKQEMGLFEGTGTDISGGYDIQLAKESQKLRMLNLYMADKDARVNKLGKAANTILNLRGDKNDKYSPVTTFDRNKVEEYIKTEAPTLYKKSKEQEELNAKEYEKASKDNSWYYDTAVGLGKVGNGLVNGFLDRINQVATASLSSLGMESQAEELRLVNEERELSRPTVRNAAYASGKLTNVDGVNYLVDGKGTIYDADRKIVVNDLLNPFTANNIMAKAANGQDSYIFSPLGTSEQLSTVIGDMAVQFGLQYGIGKLGSITKIPFLSKGMTSSIAAQSALGYSSGYNDTYKAAIDAGLPESEAKSLASTAGKEMGMLYAITAPLSTQERAVEAMFGSARKSLAKEAVKEYMKSGSKGFLAKIGNGVATMSKEGGKELIQENIQQAGEMLVNAETNEDAKRTLLKDYTTVDDFVNTSILSFGAGALMASPGSFSSKDKLSLLKQMTNNEMLFKEQLPELVNSGVVTQKQADEIANDVKVYKSQSRRIPPYVHTDVSLDIMKDLQSIQDLEVKKKTLDPSFHEDIDAQIADKRASIKNNLLKSNDLNKIDERIAKDISRTKAAVKKLGLDSDVDVVDVNNYDELYKYLSENTELTIAQIKNLGKGLGSFVTLTDENGEPTNRRALIINKANASVENMVTTGQHEFLHEVLFNAVKNDPAIQKQIGSTLIDHLKTITDEDAFKGSDFAKRFGRYGKLFESKKATLDAKIQGIGERLANGEVTQTYHDGIVKAINDRISKEEGQWQEEALTLLSEAISSGDVKYNETFFTKLGDIVRRILQKYGFKDISFETGKDVFNFVKDYNKSFEKGNFGKAIEKLAKTGEYKGKAGAVTTTAEQTVKESIASPKVVALEKELQDLEDEYDEGYGDMSDDEYRAKKNNIEAKIKTTIRKEAEAEASGKKVVVEKEPTSEEEEVKKIIREERGALSSDKVQQIYIQKGLSGAQDIINLFRPITKKIVDKRRDAPGFDRELLTDEIETGDGGILDLIRKYKPESGVPLAAYINKYLPLRAIATSRRILDAQFSKDVTEEVGLMATETADQNMTERMPEKSKYKNVLESNVFEPEVLKTMTNKILTNVRTLRSRVDTPTSLNKTVSPLMAEITGEMGKQLDIDIKTEMGGKKDNQLKNWLLKNKRYVLENMTTTWLMGKDGQGGMPQAIQKRIDGRWVNFPDWVGQKIDRESTSTDLAGRTSGHELVRRLPNVFNNVSNEDYLAQVLEPSGNPLRGRKESLAKAIAEEASLDIISQDLKEQGPIYEAFVANQQRVGAEISDAIANEFDRQVERGNVKQSIPVRLGVIQSQDKLANELFNAPNEDAEVSIIKKWLASDGRSIRTLVSIIFKGNHKWTTNKGIFEDILLPIISSSSKFNWVISGNSIGIAGKDSFNLKDVPKGQSIYFGEEKVPLWADVDYIKKNWESSIDTINKEALEATDNIIDIVNYFKNKRGTEFGTVYHGGDIVDLDSISDGVPLFVTESDSEAIAYSKGNDGHTFVANIDMNTIAKEEVARDILQEMGYDEEYMLHELIDPRFESTYIGDDNVKKLYQEVKKQGYEGVEFMDTGIADKRNVTNIVLVAPKKTLRNSGFDTTRIVNERKAIDLLEEGYKPVINGDVVENVTEDEIGTLLSKNGTIKMTKYNPRPTERYTEKDFRNYLSILKYDQRGLIRKLHKAGMAVLGMKSSDVPYLEHNKPSYDVAEEIVNLFNGKITEDEFRSIVSDAKVNLVPTALNEYLPKYVEGQNRMHADDVVLYLKALEDSGLKLLDIQNEYDSRENFDKMVAAAKARNATKHTETIDEELKDVMPESLSVKQSLGKSEEFNKIIEDVKGVDRSKVYSDITARRRGAGLNKYDFYVPPSAADFELLLYNFMGKGALGEEHKKFFDDQFLKPYSHGIDLMDSARQDIKNDFKSIAKAFPKVKKKLESLIPDKDFTYDQALRVAIWSESSVEIPGLSRRDQTKLTDLVNNDIELNAFKEGLKRTSRQPDGWLKPEDFWETKTIISDLHDITEGVGRKKFLEEFIENVEAVFGKWNNGKLVGENMNKIEAVYGTNVREALEDSLYRMSNGKNRSSGQDKEASAWMNWVNGSTGAIMFLNTRSAILQLTGSVNFLNLRDNNPIMAAKAFANQPQYWSDFAMIFNSDKIKERRSGLKDDVSAAEIANAAKGAKNKAGAVLSYLLKIGYTPTQIADSLAIAIGGAPFYRNRVNSYLKEGLDISEAETKAWDDFSKVSDETQQSGDPRDISKQQASSVGRLILAFQNTSMQQSRIIKKSYLDLKNGRGDAITNIAKITYYLAIQNTMFAVLQSGLFALMFDDDDEDDKEKAKKKKTGEDKALEIGNSVLDSVLRGTGFGGAIVATLKNIAVKYMEESDKGFKGDYTKVLLEGANISPPIGSKARKAYSAMQTSKYEKGLMDRRKWDIMQNGRVHLSPRYHVGAKAIEAVTNVPLDRFVNKVENISEAMNAENKAWQRVMVGLGYTPYSVGIQNTGDEEIKAEIKAEKKIASKEKAKAKREFVKDSIASLPPEEYIKYLEKKGESKQRKKDSIAALSPEEYIKYLEYKKKKRKRSSGSSDSKFKLR